MKREKIKLIVNVIGELLEKTNSIVVPSIRMIISELEKNYKTLLSGDIEALVKIAINYEEKNTDEYGLEDAVKWFKYNISDIYVTGARGCILKTYDQKNEIIELHHCFINKNNKPLINNESPYLLVKTIDLSSDLISQFGDKDMILLQ